jgi:hypothetical protein
MKKTAIIFSSVLAGSLLMGAMAFAAGPMWGSRSQGFRGQGMMGRPAVVGTVSAVNGTTLTVASKGFGRMATATAATSYTVDASSATVAKNGATSTVSAIAAGDTVMVRGTVSGTSVTATAIFDGMPGRGKGPGRFGGESSSTSPRPAFPIQGNGQPVVGGTVTAISGSTVTVTNKSNVTYTIDATNAAIVKGGATSTLASVSVNDQVLVQGTVNGTSVAASSILDQGAAPAAENAASPNPGLMGRMFEGVGSFFHRIFGFF